MLIYLDNCCYNRPFDDLSHKIIKTEAEAKMFIQSLIKYGMLKLANSFVLMYEVSKCPFEYKKEHIFAFIGENASKYINAEMQSAVSDLSQKIIATGIKPMDAAHIACAILSKCEYFITTDKRALKYECEEIKIVNPIKFVQIWEGNYDK